MKSSLVSLLFLCVFLPVATGFVPVTFSRSAHRASSSIVLGESTKNTDVSSLEATNTTAAEDRVAKQTLEILEAIADAEEDGEEGVQDQIFSPYSFWTERSGRYPRKINE